MKNNFDFFPESAEELYKYVTNEEILTYYFGSFQEHASYLSPFPWRDDTKPSFTISNYKGDWVWRDFGLDTRPKDGISFVRYLHGEDENTLMGFEDSLKEIYTSLVLEGNLLSKTKRKTPVPKILDIGLKIWKPKFDITLSFWNNLDVGKKDIEFYKLFEGQIWINKKLALDSNKYRVLTIYYFDKILKVWKGYNPFPRSKELKFFSNNIADHIQNWSNLGIGHYKKILFITKSYKDCIVLNKLGFDAIAPHSESMFLAPWDIDYLRELYPYIYVFYDNDKTGVTKCKQFTDQNKLSYINVPKDLGEGIKDPSDVVNEYSYNELFEVILEKLSRDNIHNIDDLI